MEIIIEKQLISVAYSLILGLIFGAAYDIIRMIHIICGIASYSGKERFHRRGLIPGVLFFLFDMAYMLSVTAVFSVFVYFANYGDFRWYLMAGAAVGFTVYYLTIGRLVMYFSEAVARFLKLVFRYTVVIPVKFILRLIGKIAGWIYRRTFGKLISWITDKYYMWRNDRYAKQFQKDIEFTEKQ